VQHRPDGGDLEVRPFCQQSTTRDLGAARRPHADAEFAPATLIEAIDDGAPVFAAIHSSSPFDGDPGGSTVGEPSPNEEPARNVGHRRDGRPRPDAKRMLAQSRRDLRDRFANEDGNVARRAFPIVGVGGVVLVADGPQLGLLVRLGKSRP